MNRLSLRQYFISSLLLALFAVTVVATFLWQASNRMGEVARFMQNGVESVSAAQSVRASLDRHRRQSLMREIAPLEQRERLRAAEEAKLIVLLGELTRLSVTEKESEAAEGTRNAVLAYINGSSLSRESGLSGVDLWQSTTPIFDRATSSLQDLIDLNVEQTVAMEKKVVAEGRSLRHLLLTALMIVTVSVGFIIWFFRQALYLPLMRLRGAIADFSSTSESSLTASLDRPGLREIAEISRAFRHLGRRLKRQNEDRVLFLSALAHDLKNPLGAIEMSLELLSPDLPDTAEANQGDGMSRVERGEISAIVHRQMGQLRNLVDDILDGSRIEAGHFEVRRTRQDVRHIVRDSARLFSSLLSNHKLELVVPPHPVEMFVDPHRLGQVLNNLLSNAIKYSPDGGVITVRLRSDEREVRLTVEDQGLGIEPDEIPHIFEPFRRAKSSRDRIPGVGLGLASSKKIVEAHQGRVEVSSRLGAGSVFTLRFPHIAPAPAHPAPELEIG